MIEIEFETNERNFIIFRKIVLWERLKSLGLQLAFYLLCLFFVFLSFHINLITDFIITGIYCIVIAGYFYFVPLWKSIRRNNKYIVKEGPFPAGPRKMIIDDSGISTSGGKKDYQYNWASLKSANINEKFLYIITADKMVLLIEREYLTSKEQETQVLELLKSNIKINSPRYKSDNPAEFYKNKPGMFSLKAKPPYLLGLLCLIPIIGAFVGLGLLLYGIFVYKEKWISIIGAGGILFTGLIIYSTGYSDSDKNEFKKLFVRSDKTELNTIVKEIEFYKLQNGSYPDSLQQLDTKGSATNIDDPLLSYINGKGSYPFNYHKTGNKYTLFSSGIDQKANTADDIYPTIDTTKTGLIIQRVKP